RIQRQCEQTLRPPFETVLASVRGFDRGRAVPGEHVHDLLEEMLLRGRLRPRFKIEQKDRDEIAAAFQVRNAAIDAEARPGRGWHLDEVDAKILGDWHPFLFGPG